MYMLIDTFLGGGGGGTINNATLPQTMQVDYVRDTRDELRESYLYWEEMIKLWEPLKPIPSTETERTVQETYRFAARNFSSGVAWAGG